MSHREHEDPFGDWAASVSQLLSANKKHSATTSDHGDILGRVREAFVSEVLRRFLPQALHVGHGQILDGLGHYSKQIDVVVYRHDMPLLTSLAETNLYFVEGVVSTIEVKSHLDRSKLWEALDNCRSVKALDVAFPSRGKQPNDFMDMRYFCPATYVFGYQGYTTRLSDLTNALFGWIRKRGVVSLSDLPEAIVTEGMVVVKNDYRCFDSNLFRRRLGRNPIFLAARDVTPLRWLLHHLLGQMGNGINPVFRNTSITELLRRNYLAREALEGCAEFWGTWDRDTEPGRILSLD